MSRDKTVSRDRIIIAAIEEFSEFGYEKASMRGIGARCGLTAAALYRHFDSKEALFDELVRSAAEDLNKWVQEKLAINSDKAKCAASENKACDFGTLWNGIVMDVMKSLIYPRMSEYSLLINKSAGSKYESYLNDFVSIQEDSIWEYLKAKKELGYKVMEVSDVELHIILSSYCSALFEPIAHEYTLEEALHYLDTIDSFFRPGLRKLMGSDS